MQIRDEILKRVDIVSTISKYLDLIENGQNYKALCPFHNDNNPSMVVSPQKQIFKCFVCGEGGNSIDFISKYENITLAKTIEKLALELEIKYKFEVKDEKDYLLEDLKEFYSTILKSSKLGEEAKHYFSKIRKLEDKIISKFELGFSPDNNALLKFLKMQIDENKHYSQMTIEELDIFNKLGKDFFYNRVIFPIYNEKSKIVGFGGRILTEGNIKYLNSKESSWFDKKKILYNFNNYDQNEKFLVVVEGYMDVITATSKGVPNVVATMGVAFSKYHLELIKRQRIKTVYLGFDKDNAGQKATSLTAELMLKNNLNVEILDFNEAKDIDEYFQNPLKTWEQLKKKSKNYINYLLENTIITTTDEKINFIAKSKMQLRILPNDIKKEILISEITQKLQIKESLLEVENTGSFRNSSNKITNSSKTLNGDIKKNKTAIPNEQEKILFYISANNYEEFIELNKIINEGEFQFIELSEEYEKLKELYKDKKKINKTILEDIIPQYSEISKYMLKFESMDVEFQKNKIANYLEKNKVKKQTGLFK